MDRFVLTQFVLTCALVSAFAYETCDPSRLAYRFDGYTYTMDTVSGEKVWSHCAFPSPLYDFQLCSWPASTVTPKYICDPDQLLLDHQVAAINERLYYVQTKTDTVCSDRFGSQSFIAGVVLIKRIRIPDLADPQLCVNDCHLLYPVWNTTSTSYPTDAQQTQILANFADGIRNVWHLGYCGNDVIILYCQEFNKVYISRGSQASRYLSDSKLNDLTAKFASYLSGGTTNDALYNGINYLIDEITTSLRGITYAQKLLIACMVLVVLFAAWFFFYLVVREKEMDVWGNEQPWKLFEWLLFSVTGLYVIEGMMYLMIHFSHKGLNLGLLGCLLVLILCVVGYYIGRVVLDV